MKYAEQAAHGKAFDLKATVQYCCDQIKQIIEKVGPRAPGSPQELEAQKMMAKELEQWADDVQIEEFTVHRQAFMGFIPFTVAMGIIASFLYWFDHALIGLILVLLGAIPLVLEFVMYKQFIDPLFPGHPSHNVIATRKPKGEVKRRIFLVGHSDSQYEWTLNYKLGGNGMKAVLIPAVVGFIICGAANLVKLLVVNVAGVELTGGLNIFFKVFGVILFCLFPCFIGFLFFQNPFKSVPGANDNLTGCYVAMSTLKTLAEADIRFEHTEVVVLLSGSEEAGLRGAKAYAKRHKEELLATETVVLGLDTFRDLKDLAVYDRDLSGTLKHDKQAKELVKNAASNCGLDLPYASIYIGACDAAAFTQIGVKATGFAAMDPTPPRYYHTRLDSWELLEPEAIRTGIEVVTETCCMYDAVGFCEDASTVSCEESSAFT